MAKDIGEVIKSARAARGWSQERLAEVLGVSQMWVSRKESGASRVTTGELRRLVVILGIDDSDLLSVLR